MAERRLIVGAVGVVAAALLVWAAVEASPVSFRAGTELDLRDDYSSLDELEGEASDVVLVEPTGESRTETISGAAFRVTEAEVVAADDGPLAPGDVVEIRQDGEYFQNAAPHPEPGHRYLAYLKPWTLGDGKETGQHTVVSTQAVWRVYGSAALLTTWKSSLPRVVTVSGSGDDLAVSG